MPDISRLEEIEDEKSNLPEQNGNEPEVSKERSPAETKEVEAKVVEMEQVMNNGMLFLTGLFKMSTGKDMGVESQSIQIDKETGEVVMKFKLPM